MTMKKNSKTTIIDGSTIETEEEIIADDRDAIAPLGYHRGIRGCLKDGWRIFALGARRYLVQLLPAAAVVGIGSCLLFHFLVQYYADHIAPALFLMRAGVDASLVWQQAVPGTSDIVTAVGLLLLYIICAGAGRASLWTQIQLFASDGALPKKKWIVSRRVWLPSFVRCLCYNAVVAVAFLIVTAIVGGIAYATSWWYALLFLLPIGLFLMVLAIPGRTAFVMGATWRNAFSLVRHEGFRRFGGYLILVCLTFLPLLLATVVLVLPSANFVMAHSANAINAVISEPSGITPLAELFDYVILALTFAFIYLIRTFQTWTLALMKNEK